MSNKIIKQYALMVPLLAVVLMLSCQNYIDLYRTTEGCTAYMKVSDLTKTLYIDSNSSLFESKKWNLIYEIEKRGLKKTVYQYDSKIRLEFIDSSSIAIYKKKNKYDTIQMHLSSNFYSDTLNQFKYFEFKSTEFGDLKLRMTYLKDSIAVFYEPRIRTYFVFSSSEINIY